jgi:large subunit ribosomal protein L22
MEVKAQLNYLRISPRKTRLLADLVRGKKLKEAINLLGFSYKKGSQPFKKLLEQALANAKNNFNLSDENVLYISRITVDEGPKLKRWRARAHGRAAEIQKKTSHISLIVSGVEKKKKKVKEEKTEEKKVAASEKKEVVKEKETEKEKEKKKMKSKFLGKDRDQAKELKFKKGISKKDFRRKAF